MCHEYLINDHPVDKVAKGTPSWGSRGSKDAVHVPARCSEGMQRLSMMNTECAQWVKASG